MAKQRWPLFGVKAHSRSLGFPDFLLILMALADFMRFFPTENRTRGLYPVQHGRKSGYARDDKGESGAIRQLESVKKDR